MVWQQTVAFSEYLIHTSMHWCINTWAYPKVQEALMRGLNSLECVHAEDVAWKSEHIITLYLETCIMLLSWARIARLATTVPGYMSPYVQFLGDWWFCAVALCNVEIFTRTWAEIVDATSPQKMRQTHKHKCYEKSFTAWSKIQQLKGCGAMADKYKS